MIEAEYFRVHNWLSYHYGKAICCESAKCNSINPKRFEWALIKNMECIRNRENFIQLCPSCHRKYDYTAQESINKSASAKGRLFSIETRKRISETSMGRGATSIIQKNKSGDTLKYFNSVSQAVRETKILQGSISNALTKRAKTAGGFIWEYQHKK